VAQRVGVGPSSTTRWLHTDRQGSVVSVTDSSGTEVQHMIYRPYGDRLSTATSLPVSQGYIGERQDETGLLYLHARYYDPRLGRFISPDPTIPGTGVVHLNRYAYADNDPIRFQDTSGYDAVDEIGDCVGNLFSLEGSVGALYHLSGAADVNDAFVSGDPAAIILSTLAMADRLRGSLETAFTVDFGGAAGLVDTGLGGSIGSDASLATLVNDSAALGSSDSLVPLAPSLESIDVGLSAPLFQVAEPPPPLFTEGASPLDTAPMFEAGGPCAGGACAQVSGAPAYPYYFPRDESGAPIPLATHLDPGTSVDIPLPHPEATTPHTVLGGTTSSSGTQYLQAATFEGPSWPQSNGQDVPVGRIDFYNHGRPDHADVHIHPYLYDSRRSAGPIGNPNGGYYQLGGNGLPHPPVGFLVP
jgi:RHS repeat-associated protein